MPFSKRSLSFLLIITILFSACSGYEKVLKSNDINYKLTKANEYFDKKQYQKANAVYESLLPILKGTKNFEPLYFRYAYTSYYLKDYLPASYHFKNFTDYFPASKDAEEAEYMHAVSLYKMSPKASLEQTNSYKAMEAMQSYINTHPKSKRLEEANNYVDALRQKLEKKDASAAKLYFDLGQFKAAGIAYKSVIQTYPDSPQGDFYQYMVVRSFFNYAEASIAGKQEERFANAANAYIELKDNFPDTKYLPEAQKFYSQANDNIQKLRENEPQ